MNVALTAPPWSLATTELDSFGVEPILLPGVRYAGDGQRLLASGLVRRVLADVVVAADVADSRDVRAAAIALMAAELAGGEGWAVAYRSAGWLHTGWSPERRPPDLVELIVPPGRRRRIAGVRTRQVAIPADDIVHIGGVPVTTPTRTAADIARDLPEPEALTALHRLRQVTGIQPREVLARLSGMPSGRGVAHAKRLVRQWAAGG